MIQQVTAVGVVPARPGHGKRFVANRAGFSAILRCTYDSSLDNNALDLRCSLRDDTKGVMERWMRDIGI